MNTICCQLVRYPEAEDIATRCDFCANACGGCSWSEKNLQTPVGGWDAVRRDIPLFQDAPLTESYVVIQCPQFALEPRRKRLFEKVDWAAVRVSALECPV